MPICLPNLEQHSPGIEESGTYQTAESADGKFGDISGYSTFAVRTAYDFGEQFDGLKNRRGDLKTCLINNISLVLLISNSW